MKYRRPTVEESAQVFCNLPTKELVQRYRQNWDKFIEGETYQYKDTNVYYKVSDFKIIDVWVQYSMNAFLDHIESVEGQRYNLSKERVVKVK